MDLYETDVLRLGNCAERESSLVPVFVIRDMYPHSCVAQKMKSTSNQLHVQGGRDLRFVEEDISKEDE